MKYETPILSEATVDTQLWRQLQISAGNFSIFGIEPFGDSRSVCGCCGYRLDVSIVISDERPGFAWFRISFSKKHWSLAKLKKVNPLPLRVTLRMRRFGLRLRPHSLQVSRKEHQSMRLPQPCTPKEQVHSAELQSNRFQEKAWVRRHPKDLR
jgi:hypothetical protein